jgi:hypothetical protein
VLEVDDGLARALIHWDKARAHAEPEAQPEPVAETPAEQPVAADAEIPASEPAATASTHGTAGRRRKS